ncbi:hypothetical protein [Blastococcus brunescens]|uniref:HTH asnC-type domain-containing protein n=1 Tax=Blastococcus brunescens TaxID=1564165 RepID=A0ABZ1B9V4_9ACTN|nr:hypothetical protein [Blastococcus sp. BMG 8361]WRL66678.1 hypothetical protein U6N30_15570 [Blastococcus sp. BMG 8361]
MAHQLSNPHSSRMVERRTLDALDVALLGALRRNPRAGALELSRITGSRAQPSPLGSGDWRTTAWSPATARTSTWPRPASRSRPS